MAIHLKIDGIDGGESSDAHHRGWLGIVSMTWGVQRRLTAATGTRGDRESANASITDLELTREMDAISPRLFTEACCGKGRRVTIDLTTTGAGAGASTYMRYTLHNALISRYDVDADAQDVSRPLERVTISFLDLQVRYTPYDDDGNAMPSLGVGFNTATNEKH